jgi:hypothetical protein
MFEFVLAAPARCQLCRREVSEKTVVDRGGIEVAIRGPYKKRTV